MLALPIFPGRRQPSIVSRNELNYRVRNGNGWTLALISTNYLSSGLSGEHPVLYCLFCALSRDSLFDLQTSAAFEDREGKAAEGMSFRTLCGSERSAACFDVVTRTGFEPMLTA